jgi:acetyl-CoA carboxylase carboxyltransferase component
LKEEENPEQSKEMIVAEFRNRFSKPYNVAASGHIDEVLVPAETRPHLIAALELLQDKKVNVRNKKHGNIPM